MVLNNPQRRTLLVLVGLTVLQAVAGQFIMNDTLSCQMSNSFNCAKSGRCIPLKWLCDMEEDCAFGEDEENCEMFNQFCDEKTEYHCTEPKETPDVVSMLRGLHGSASLYTHRCVPKTWLCDGDVDCINGDDESNCPLTTCNNATQFQCVTHEHQLARCIPRKWVCDGHTDCLDMSDEANCTHKLDKCTADEFHCHSGECIYPSWRCDGEPNCRDGSDETDCDGVPAHECKGPEKFQCASGETCIPSIWRCDREPDCPDRSDELNCDGFTSLVNCTDSEFKCSNGALCVNLHWVCDGDMDCLDGSDEKNCNTLRCGDNERMCADGKACYGREAVCDDFRDCGDGSDERDCVAKETPTNTTTTAGGTVAVTSKCNPITEFTCPGAAQCVPLIDLCKTPHDDCAISVCDRNITTCKETDKECVCRKTGKEGKVCHCNSGLRFNGEVCEDIDECKDHGICDQICINKYRGYICDCYPGYMLTIGTTAVEFTGRMPHKCRAVGQDPKLLLSNRATIRQYDIVTNKYHPLISSLESAVALDYWHKNQTLIWSDVSKQQIMICHIGNQSLLNNIGDCLEHGNVTLISDDIQTPDGLAVDWVHGLLFWTDTGYNTISVFNLLTKHRKVIVDENLDEPRAIAVDPSAGLIFWTDWGVNASIERAGMDGKNRMVIVRGDAVRWPNGLALDILARRVYWADAKLKTISSCDYWGNNVRTVLHSHRYLRHPFSLAVFEEKLYWTDWDHEGVISVNKFHGNDAKTLVSGMTGPMTVRVYHKQAQPDHPDKCERHQCDQLCLPRAHMKEHSESREQDRMGAPYTCACDRGFKLSAEPFGICVPLNVVEDVIASETSSRIPYLYFIMLFIVAVALVLVFVQYRQRPNHFTVLHFDNPIYRRTVEDLDADLENPPDTSLGAISTIASNSGRNGVSLSRNNDSRPDIKLMLAQSDNAPTNAFGSSLPQVVDVTDSSKYSFDQPHA